MSLNFKKKFLSPGFSEANKTVLVTDVGDSSRDGITCHELRFVS